MAERNKSRSPALWLLAGLLAATGPLAAAAQTGPGTTTAPAKAPKPYQGPLDTIMSTHLWTDVPATQDFVKATHPDPKALDYTPLTGKDPDRPKPRDAAGIDSLRAELEHDGQMNETKAKGLGGTTKPVKPHARKPVKGSARTAGKATVAKAAAKTTAAAQ